MPVYFGSEIFCNNSQDKAVYSILVGESLKSHGLTQKIIILYAHWQFGIMDCTICTTMVYNIKNNNNLYQGHII